VLIVAVTAILGAAGCAPAGYPSRSLPADEDPPSQRLLDAAPAGSAPVRAEPRAANRAATRTPLARTPLTRAANRAPLTRRPATRAPAAPGPAPVSVPDGLDFTARMLDGRVVRGAALLGRPAVLWFFTPGSPVSQAQVPEVVETARRFGGTLSVVAVAGLDRTATITAFVADRGLAGITTLSDGDGVLWRRFGVTQQGDYVLVDARGVVWSSGTVPGGELADRVARMGR
jgi:hypothetical protein